MPTPKKKSKTSTTPRRKARRRFPKGGPTKAELRKYREALVEMRGHLLRSSEKLADEALKGSGQDNSYDDWADHGSDNFEQSFSLTLLEGEAEIFRAVQTAIEKIDGKGELPFGLCENCADDAPPEDSDERCGACPWIAKGRLAAVPYARLCVGQQEIEEQKGT